MKLRNSIFSKAITLGVLFGGTLLGSTAVQADVLDNKGKDFIVSFLDNYLPNTPVIEIHLTADVATDVTVEYPVNNPTFSEVVNVVPGAVSVVLLPSDAADGWSFETPFNNAIRMSASQEFVAYMINRVQFTSDAALALPVDTMNKDYIVMTYDDVFEDPRFVVTAAFDNTTVTITPNIPTLDANQPAGVPFNVVLNRGEGYYVQGNGDSLAGTIVSADKPVGVTNGNGCTQVPNGTSYCDSIFEVAQPTQTWGTQVPVVNLPNRPNGSIYRIMAANDGTVLLMDGLEIANLNRGQFFETESLPNNHLFAANKPIFVVQFMTGSTSPGADLGDPAMGNMVPTEQFLKAYTFSTVGGSQFEQNFLSIIANNNDIGTVTLDGVAIGAAAFTAIPGTTFSSAVVELSQGTHTTLSASPHGIMVSGYNDDDSYLYPGGALFNFINPTGDANPPICTLNGLNGTATDNRPSEDTNNNGILDAGEDLNGNNVIDTDSGVFFVALQDGSSNVNVTVNPFVPGSASVNFTVSLIDAALNPNGIVLVTDGAGNTCQAVISNSAVCSQSDIKPGLLSLDGSALTLSQLVNKAAKQLKNAGGKKKDVSEIRELSLASYTNAWIVTWSIVPKVNICDNDNLCPIVSNSSAVNSYLSNATSLKQLLDSTIAKVAALKGGLTPGLKKLKKSGNIEFNKAKTAAAGIPVNNNVCGDSVDVSNLV
ncbi:MAG: IgGFc-binding protein [bacterium]|nr:IgGFc-binding protein [bacterium]